MTMKQKWDNLTFIPGPNKGRYPFCHSLFLDDEVKVLVDPAADPEALKRIGEERGVDVVLLSHYHEDHWTFMSLFPKAKIFIHEADAPPMSDLNILLDFYGMTPGADETVRYCKELKNFFHYNPKPPDRVFKDNEVLSFGKTSVEVIHTPGHSPGHCCFYFREQDVLFLADYDLTKFGPWYGDRVSDIDALIESSKRIRTHPAKFKVTAHEAGVLIGDLENTWRDYLAVIDARQHDLETALRTGPKTMREIIELRLVYKKVKEPQSFFDFGERAIMGKHLERMIRIGTAIFQNNRYHLT